ncbi:hypothetical protein [Mycobacteroides abscessus]|uniref:hypothetical protein n=1 Tax=Mycobacteroides abscessus TaxID=36809 RepID=UPI00266E9A51|nr:hypothetical protein [Mycobacteroides abscessus]MDO3110472.1 hypothetical protein [Mycobacteroides abscessus subsp. abscessus]
MDEFSEDLPGPRLPDWVEQFLARERTWHRTLREAGLVTPAASAAELMRWIE